MKAMKLKLVKYTMMMQQLIGSTILTLCWLFRQISCHSYFMCYHIGFGVLSCRLLNRDHISGEESSVDEEDDGFLKAFKVYFLPNVMNCVLLVFST